MFLKLCSRNRISLCRAINYTPRTFRAAALQPSKSVVRPAHMKWYSSESEVKEDDKEKTKPLDKEIEDTTNNNDGDHKNPKKSAEEQKSDELAAKNKEIIELKDRYLRTVAEFRNLQQRTKRDVQAARDFALQKFAKDLIESIDNLDRALNTVPKEKLTPTEMTDDRKDLISMYEGLKMTESVLMNTLTKHGLERFDPSINGDQFNPNEHEATFMVPVEGKEENTVFITQQKGFKLNGRILRAAKVGVVKNT